MKEYCVYKHSCPNGKVYIGQTCKKPNERWSNGYGYKDQLFYSAILKYGWENIEHEIIFNGLTKDEADKKEIELISYYDSTNKDKGYNVAFGGGSTLGVKCSEETKKKISKAHKGEKRSEESKSRQSDTMLGHYCSDETKKKIGVANSNRIWSKESKEKLSKANKGKVASDETRRKISEAGKGRPQSEKSKMMTAQRNRERIWTDESREKISKANKGRPAPNRKIVICVETGIVYNSIHCASVALDISSAGIGKVCKGHREAAGGYHWKYYDDVKDELEANSCEV